MNSTTLIPMNRAHRLLKKVRGYISDMELFLSDPATAVSIMLNALPHAEPRMLLKMLPLLGSAGKDRVLWPLYGLLTNASQDEPVRMAAAIQLGLAASTSDDATALRDALIEKLDHPDPHVRSCCALALGWEKNWPAVSALAAHLADPDRDVQSAVVAALSSVGDDRVFDLLNNCLERGSLDEQRLILLHLWRFSKQRQKVEVIYLGRVANAEAELCLDILAAIAQIPLSSNILDLYSRLLVDEDARIRLQVLENLSQKNPIDYKKLKHNLELLLEDKDARIRQAVVRLFAGA